MIAASEIRGHRGQLGAAAGGELVHQVEVNPSTLAADAGRVEGLGRSGIGGGRLAAARTAAGGRQDAIAATMAASV